MESTWKDIKHVPATRSVIYSPIREMVERVLQFPKPPHLKPINLGLGEPTKENGFDIPVEAS